MTTKINLLPWRETHRKETNNSFYISMAVCAAVAALIGFGGYKYAEDKVAFQDKRNQRLESEIAQLQSQLKEIEELEETKNKLLARMEIIQQLQGQRPQIVHTFHEVAGRIPDGVFLTAMKQSGNQQLEISGRAESNARVSALMRRMDRSEFFKDPRLEVIEADKTDGISTFKLSVIQDAPKPEGDAEDGI